ncbi:uncharacterized protein LOC130986546 [Salvia miltiorrhiza]|uniref:uncharacterized protein LOC130986546 n=1 Tax=Salvia miltiorrhiza TaxID=226208 RepID=UPI0025AC422F|nr:uncharacterized protein LOC130986546 [Salvia miltiorrhiza]
MASTRLLRMSKPLGLTTETLVSIRSSVSSRPGTLMCLNKVGLSSDIPPGGAGERKPAPAKAAGCSSSCAVVSEPKTDKRTDLGILFVYVADALSHWRKFVIEKRPWGLHAQMFLEKTIVDCRFFTLLAIGGSLICSVLCFFEGCFLVVGSYFHALSRMSEQAQVVHQLMEAIDMFIMGTAMLVFAMALYVMFVGSHDSDSISGSSKNFNLKSWMGRGSAMEAKSKIGHAVMLILQVQVLDKFRSIAVSNGMDLACFAGAIFLSSASIFVLSRISSAPAYVDHK